MARVSVIMAARNEAYVARTVQDVFEKATGDVEVTVIQDGPPYRDIPARKGLTVINGPYQGLKPCVNQAAALATGKHLFKIDAHVMLSTGFDEVLQSEMESNWIVFPRFYVLDAEKWQWQDERFYDYFYLDSPLTDPKGYRFKAGGHWPQRTQERLNVGPLDESLTLHGSAWFIGRDFFLNKLGGMQVEGYGVSFMEPADLGLRAWLGPWGGKVMVNKACWYSHMHKGGQRERGYPISMTEVRRSYLWTANYWMRNQWPERAHDMAWLIDRFSPVPTWPDDWKERQAKYEKDNPL